MRAFGSGRATGGPDVRAGARDAATDRPESHDALRLRHVPVRAAVDYLQFQNGCAEAAAWNNVQGNGGTAAAGDYGVLGGMREQQGDHRLDLADLLVATQAGYAKQLSRQQGRHDHQCERSLAQLCFVFGL